jgi:hypothetical protein
MRTTTQSELMFVTASALIEYFISVNDSFGFGLWVFNGGTNGNV